MRNTGSYTLLVTAVPLTLTLLQVTLPGFAKVAMKVRTRVGRMVSTDSRPPDPHGYCTGGFVGTQV
jgi:hypothetical protein